MVLGAIDPGVSPLEMGLRLPDDRHRRRARRRQPGAPGPNDSPRRLPRPSTRSATDQGRRHDSTTRPGDRPQESSRRAKNILETSSRGTGVPPSRRQGRGARPGRPRTTATPGSAAAPTTSPPASGSATPTAPTPMSTDYNGGPVDGGTYPALIWGADLGWQEIEPNARPKRRREGRGGTTGDELELRDNHDENLHRPRLLLRVGSRPPPEEAAAARKRRRKRGGGGTPKRRRKPAAPEAGGGVSRRHRRHRRTGL